MPAGIGFSFWTDGGRTDVQKDMEVEIVI